ncbi:MAG: cation diffusion facilitator family transporter, partial [Candidatus Omnitrophota bacterium]
LELKKVLNGAVILNVGPGPTLREAVALLRKYPAISKVIVVERFRGNVEDILTEWLYLEQDLQQKIELWSADATDLSFPPNSFGMIFADRVLKRQMIGSYLEKTLEKMQIMLVDKGALVGCVELPSAGFLKECLCLSFPPVQPRGCRKPGPRSAEWIDCAVKTDGGTACAESVSAFFEIMDITQHVIIWTPFAEHHDAASLPNLKICRITDRWDDEYDCLSWTLGWTDELVKRPELYDSLYKAHGYIQVSNVEAADIVLYELNGKVTHSALRFSRHWWESKLGKSYRVIHTLDELRGGIYGEPARFYGRAGTDGGQRLPMNKGAAYLRKLVIKRIKQYSPDTVIVFIDGSSGVGKTFFSGRICPRGGVVVLHADDYMIEESSGFFVRHDYETIAWVVSHIAGLPGTKVVILEGFDILKTNIKAHVTVKIVANHATRKMNINGNPKKCGSLINTVNSPNKCYDLVLENSVGNRLSQKTRISLAGLDGGEERLLRKGFLVKNAEGGTLAEFSGIEIRNFDRLAEYLKATWSLPDLRVYDPKRHAVFYNYIYWLLMNGQEMYNPEKENLKADAFAKNELDDTGISVFGDFMTAGLLTQWFEDIRGKDTVAFEAFARDLKTYFSLSPYPALAADIPRDYERAGKNAGVDEAAAPLAGSFIDGAFEYPLTGSPMKSGITFSQCRNFSLGNDPRQRTWNVLSWNTLPRHWLQGRIPEFWRLSVVDNGKETVLYSKENAKRGEEVREAELSSRGKYLVIIKNTGLQVMDLDRFAPIMEVPRNKVLAGARLVSDDALAGVRRFYKDGEIITFARRRDGGCDQRDIIPAKIGPYRVILYKAYIVSYDESLYSLGLGRDDSLGAYYLFLDLAENVMFYSGVGTDENIAERVFFSFRADTDSVTDLLATRQSLGDAAARQAVADVYNSFLDGGEVAEHDHGLRSGTLAFVLGLTAVYMIVEIAGGVVFNSLALTADAGHMAADLAGLVCALMAQYTTERLCLSPRYNGNSAAQLAAASLNSLLLLGTAAYVLFAALQRYSNPLVVGGWGMLALALGGLLVNIYSARKLHSHSNDNLTMEGAYLHAVGDMLGSIGAVSAGVLIVVTGLSIFDLSISIVLGIWLTVNGAMLMRKVAAAFRNADKPEKETDDGTAGRADGGRRKDTAAVWPVREDRGGIITAVKRVPRADTVILMNAADAYNVFQSVSDLLEENVLDPGKSYFIPASNWVSTDLPYFSGLSIDERIYRKGAVGSEKGGDIVPVIVKNELGRVTAGIRDGFNRNSWNKVYPDVFRKENGIIGIWFGTAAGLARLYSLPVITFEDARDLAMTFSYKLIGNDFTKVLNAEIEKTTRLGRIAAEAGRRFSARYDLHDFPQVFNNGGLREARVAVESFRNSGFETRVAESGIYLLDGGDAPVKPVFRYSVTLSGAREFDESLIGNKAKRLSELKAFGEPVPEAFVLTSEYFDARADRPDIASEAWEEVMERLSFLERATGKKFGDPENPLILSARSSSCVSMPGVLETVMNIGVNDLTARGLAKIGGELFACDTYRRLIEEYSGRISSEEFSQDPYEQLRSAIETVLGSWNSAGAKEFRAAKGISDDSGMAVIIQEAVFGNLSNASATGVLYTRNPNTGADELFGHYMIRGQGKEIVSGRAGQSLMKINRLSEDFPDTYNLLVSLKNKLERYYKSPQEIEFSVQNGDLHILQTRPAVLSPLAMIIAVQDFAKDGILSPIEAAKLLEKARSLAAERKNWKINYEDQRAEDKIAAALILRGEVASPGLTRGKLIFSLEKALELAQKGESVILFAAER